MLLVGFLLGLCPSCFLNLIKIIPVVVMASEDVVIFLLVDFDAGFGLYRLLIGIVDVLTALASATFCFVLMLFQRHVKLVMLDVFVVCRAGRFVE